ncbi:hypothetical protein [Heyndrickxia ginsengihumi]|uniref:hypothetical protein n=1 Tax=Heyndrickxia ginsengihumi TaxID=363870 RepID=UPI0004B5CFD8|nr:hypothetical protein [Heyndrickxia ginsengihumi]
MKKSMRKIAKIGRRKTEKEREKAGRQSRKNSLVPNRFTLFFREQLIFLKNQDSDKK